MICTAIGAAAAAPNPPPFTITPTAIGFGLSTKQVNTASVVAEVLTPVSAVPVLPQITRPPVACGPAVAKAVPAGFWVTCSIIALTLPATCGDTAWLNIVGEAFWITARPGAI